MLVVDGNGTAADRFGMLGPTVALGARSAAEQAQDEAMQALEDLESPTVSEMPSPSAPAASQSYPFDGPPESKDRDLMRFQTQSTQHI